MRKLRNQHGHFCRLATAVLVMTGGAAGYASWREVNTGLTSAVVAVRAISIDPVTPSTIYVCSYNWLPGAGDLFKSVDRGRSWKAISSVVGTTSIVIDPKNSSTLYAGTGHGIVKSANGGESWTGANTGLTDSSIVMLAIDPITPSTLYALTSGGIFTSILKSTDGGGTWNAINTGFPDTGFDSLVIDPMAPSTLYAVSPLSTIKSTDGGGSWNVIFGFGLRSLFIDPTNSSTIYAATLPGPPFQRIVKSTDGGGTWNAINDGLPPDTFIVSLAIDPIMPSTLYAAGGGIFKSTDGGGSWNEIDTGLPSSSGQRPFSSLALDPTAPSTIYAGYFAYSGPKGAIYKSTNGGASWDAADAGLTSIDVRVLAIDPVNATTLYTAAGTDAFKSVDGGASWTKLFTFQIANSTIPFPGFGADDAIVRSLLVDFIDPNVLYAETARTDGGATGDKLVFKSTDGGANWSADISPPFGIFGAGDLDGRVTGYMLSMVLDPTDLNTLYVGDTVNLGILKSNDGGASWSSVWGRTNDPEASVRVLVIDPTKPTTLYAGTGGSSFEFPLSRSGGVFKSTDGGASWSSAGLGDTAVTVLAIGPANTVYAGTGNDYSAPQGFLGMFKSTDSGASWLPINNGLAGLFDIRSSISALVIDPQNSNILYAGTTGGGVFKSSDGGANWCRFNDGLANLDVRVLAVAPGNPNTLYAGTAGGVFATTLVP
jgi:photosystem II stability/assembly factor-like uncharacterized protein